MTTIEQAASWLADVPKHKVVFRNGALCLPTGNWPDHALTPVVALPDALAAIARHLAPGDDLVERATAADLDGLLHAARELAQYASYAEIVGGVSVNRPQVRKWCDAVFAAIKTMPEDEGFEPVAPNITALLARISALTATVREVERDRDRVADINRNLCNSHNTLLVDGSNWQRRAETAEAEAAPRLPDLGAREAALREAAQCAIDNQDCSPWEVSEAILNLIGKKPAGPYPAEAEVSTLRDRLARMEGALRLIADGNPTVDNPEADAANSATIARAALTDGGSNG